MSAFDQLLQYLHHLNIWLRHSTDSDDLDRLWNERERVRRAIDGITKPAGS
jgi:hypothetical protein